MSVFLKVKVKSLAAEAQFIRREERKQLGNARWLKGRDKGAHLNTPSDEQTHAYSHTSRLHLHRTVDVRKEARATLIAYGLIRGREFRQVENATIREAPPWERVLRMVEDHHPDGLSEIAAQFHLRVWLRKANISENLLPWWAEERRHLPSGETGAAAPEPRNETGE